MIMVDASWEEASAAGEEGCISGMSGNGVIAELGNKDSGAGCGAGCGGITKLELAACCCCCCNREGGGQAGGSGANRGVVSCRGADVVSGDKSVWLLPISEVDGAAAAAVEVAAMYDVVPE